MNNFTERFEIVYQKFATEAKAAGRQFSKLAFSRFMDVSQGRMQHWEKGQIPRPDDLLSMHDKLGFALRWLITGEGERFDESSPALNSDAKLAQKIEQLEAELAEERALNRKLTTRLLVDGGDETKDTGDVAKAAGQE